VLPYSYRQGTSLNLRRMDYQALAFTSKIILSHDVTSRESVIILNLEVLSAQVRPVLYISRKGTGHTHILNSHHSQTSISTLQKKLINPLMIQNPTCYAGKSLKRHYQTSGELSALTAVKSAFYRRVLRCMIAMTESKAQAPEVN
jgi:hypothetical protein